MKKNNYMFKRINRHKKDRKKNTRKLHKIVNAIASSSFFFRFIIIIFVFTKG